MIPKKIHYCWFGRGEMPELSQKCIASWKKYMPDYEYILWNEDNFDINSSFYTKEAYAARKYAFVSDYVRLLVLRDKGGIYLDVDFEVYKSFDNLLDYHAFAGFEGSKHNPVMMGVIASEPNGTWISEMLDAYNDRHFIKGDGSLDLTTNVQFVTGVMVKSGFVSNGKEQDYKDLHVFPVDYFCPRQTTGDYLRTENTYADHLGVSSWNTQKSGLKRLLLSVFGDKQRISLIKLKRKLFG